MTKKTRKTKSDKRTAHARAARPVVDVAAVPLPDGKTVVATNATGALTIRQPAASVTVARAHRKSFFDAVYLYYLALHSERFQAPPPASVRLRLDEHSGELHIDTATGDGVEIDIAQFDALLQALVMLGASDKPLPPPEPVNITSVVLPDGLTTVRMEADGGITFSQPTAQVNVPSALLPSFMASVIVLDWASRDEMAQLSPTMQLQRSEHYTLIVPATGVGVEIATAEFWAVLQALGTLGVKHKPLPAVR